MAKVALLIGVSDYEPGLNPLPAAVKDVEAFRRILQDPDMGGFEEVKVLTNPDPQTMQYEVETLFSGRSRDDLVLLFFSGHGIKDDHNALYFATRITRKNPKGDLIRSTAVPARFVHEVMNNSRAKRQAIILDCCFSGAFDPALQTKDDGSINLQEQLGAEGRVVLASSSSTQYSFEQHSSDLSLYTRYLLEGIETGAGDRNEDGKISVRELHEYASSRVHETAPNMTPKLITLKDMGFDLVLAKAKVTDPKLRYRRQVERYSSRGHISAIGRTILDELQTQLELSSEVAQGIESDVLRPYQERLENLKRYHRVFLEAVRHEYPLSPQAQSELEDLREVLGLRQQDVTAIEQKILAKLPQQPTAGATDQPHPVPAVTGSTAAGVPHQPVTPPASLTQASGDIQDLSTNNSPVQLPTNRPKVARTVLIAGASSLVLLVGGVLAGSPALRSTLTGQTDATLGADSVKGVFSNITSDNGNVINEALFKAVSSNFEKFNTEVKTYTVGEVKITGNRQHACNVLLPRGPGIGNAFAAPEEDALWQELSCNNLYCDLSDESCRTSLEAQWAEPDQAVASTPPPQQFEYTPPIPAPVPAPVVEPIAQTPTSWLCDCPGAPTDDFLDGINKYYGRPVSQDMTGQPCTWWTGNISQSETGGVPDGNSQWVCQAN